MNTKKFELKKNKMIRKPKKGKKKRNQYAAREGKFKKHINLQFTVRCVYRYFVLYLSVPVKTHQRNTIL